MAMLAETPFTGALADIMSADQIEPGAAPSYDLCKKLYVFHPLGAKIVDKPIRMAQSQPRKISVGGGPEDLLREQFEKTWSALDATRFARRATSVSRIYGASTLAVKVEGEKDDRPLNPWKLATTKVSFSVFDPLNTAGSMVNFLAPNDPQFQTPKSVTVCGQKYHATRTRILMNEEPIYLEYSPSAYGYVGRSVFTRGLYPLKTFLRTMRTDEMVSRKAGLLIAKLNEQGGIVNQIKRYVASVKRDLLSEGETGNVLSIALDEAIESLNLQNIDAAANSARDHAIKNIALACEVHAKILADEAFVEGFGEGTEDAKNIAMCIDGVREDMEPIYRFLDPIVMHCAWDEDFYKTVQAQYPEDYGSKKYEESFYEWKNSFKALWPSLLREPESEEVKTREVKFRVAASVLQILSPHLPPDQTAELIDWLVECINQEKMLFPTPVDLDIEAVTAFLEEQKEKQDEADEALNEQADEANEKPPKAWAKMDALAEQSAAVARLPDRSRAKRAQ